MISRSNYVIWAVLLICFLALSLESGLAQPQIKATPPVLQGSTTPLARRARVPSPARTKKIVPPSEIIVGVVGSRVLTKEQLNRKVEKLLPEETSSRDQELYDQDRRRYEGKLLYDWADIALLAVEAEAQGFTLSDEELAQNIEKLKQSADRKVDIDAALQQTGVLKAEFLQDMRDAFLGDKLIRATAEKEYPEEKLRAMYEQNRPFFIHPAAVRASHIFKGFQGKPSSEQKKALRETMEDLRKRAAGGADFEALAKESDAFSRNRGGDLGWLEAKNFLPPAVGEALFRLQVGQVSKVIESEFGYHVIKVTDIRPPRGNTFEEARDEVISSVYSDVRKRLLDSLRSKHTVILNAGGIPENLLGKTGQAK
jgi:parvulin-like peptidyl-prolyl isomerase